MDVQKIWKLMVQGKHELSKHAEKERQIDMIYMGVGGVIERLWDHRGLSGMTPAARVVWFWGSVAPSQFIQYAQ